MRRATWLATGVVLGAGGGFWAKRKIETIGKRLQPSKLAGTVASGVEERVRSLAATVSDAVDSGRADARRKEAELREEMRTRAGVR
ncbi:MAG: hypothetical protein ACYCTL_03195 [Acidimicrobiales bacterium]